MTRATDTMRSIPGGATDEPFELPDLCGRPACRQEFRQSVGRGRRKDFCSETCRRLADRDFKRARATVEHFEKLARRSRHDLLAFGRTADDDTNVSTSDEMTVAQAAAALDRADAVLRFVGDADPRIVTELEALSNGVRALVDQSRIG